VTLVTNQDEAPRDTAYERGLLLNPRLAKIDLSTLFVILLAKAGEGKERKGQQANDEEFFSRTSPACQMSNELMFVIMYE
jgi:hypothetical protein